MKKSSNGDLHGGPRGDAKGEDNTRVSSIMRRDFAVLRDTVEIENVARFLLERRITCAAVSDETGKVLGFVSMIDLVRERYLNAETESQTERRSPQTARGDLGVGFHLTSGVTARDIMMPFLVQLREDATIDSAAALMASEGVHRVLVVSESHKLVGIVSALDVLRWLAIRDGYVVANRGNTTLRNACEYATGGHHAKEDEA